MKQITLGILLTFSIAVNYSQSIKILTTNSKISLRGLSVVNNNIIWASGSNGQVAKKY